MPIRFVLDEHLRGGGLWQAIRGHNAVALNPIDAVRVGDLRDLPLGTLDPELLLWAERDGRILISRDKRSLPRHLANLIQSGHHSPGIFVLRRGYRLKVVTEFLALVADTNDPLPWLDRIEYIP